MTERRTGVGTVPVSGLRPEIGPGVVLGLGLGVVIGLVRHREWDSTKMGHGSVSESRSGTGGGQDVSGTITYIGRSIETATET